MTVTAPSDYEAIQLALAQWRKAHGDAVADAAARTAKATLLRNPLRL